MKILYFYQYFSTPKGSWGTRVYEFAREWVKEGHEVTVVSSIYSKSDLTAKTLIEDQYFDGIHVKVVNVRIDNKQSNFKRIRSFIQFSVISSYFAIVLPADVVIASSGPITAWIPGLIAKVFRGRKLILEVRDLWPDGAIELGVIKNKFLILLAAWFEKKSYQVADGVVALSPGMRDEILKKHATAKVISVTNAANLELFSTEFPFLFDLPKVKYAIYTGNIGAVNDSYWLLKTARCLRDLGREDLLIVLAGDGQQRDELVKAAKQSGLNNFVYLGLLPKVQLVPLIQNAMVSLVPLKNSPILDTSSPNKFFESLAAGVPVVQNTNGWMRQFLEENKVGFTITSGDEVALANLLIELDSSPELRSEMGNRARKLAQNKFDQVVLANKMLQFVTNIK